MGGACQHDWEHCVPKVAHADGPRLSIMFRHNLAGFTFPEATRPRLTAPALTSLSRRRC